MNPLPFLSAFVPTGGTPTPTAGPNTQTAINVYGSGDDQPLRNIASIINAMNQPQANGGGFEVQRSPTIQRASMNWVPIALLIAVGVYLVFVRKD
jgi:hypothetical protein